jgi:hypothetical protein
LRDALHSRTLPRPLSPDIGFAEAASPASRPKNCLVVKVFDASVKSPTHSLPDRGASILDEQRYGVAAETPVVGLARFSVMLLGGAAPAARAPTSRRL